MATLDVDSDNEDLDQPNDDPSIHGDFIGPYPGHGLGTRLGDFGGRPASKGHCQWYSNPYMPPNPFCDSTYRARFFWRARPRLS